MTDPTGGSDKSFSNEVTGNTLPGRSARSATLANLKALFQHQFDNEIITCVAANFGWNEWRSAKALKMLAGNQSDEEVELGMDPLLDNKSESPVSNSHNEEMKYSSKNGCASNGNTPVTQQNTSGELSPRTDAVINMKVGELLSPEMKTGNEAKSAVESFTCASIDTEMKTRADSEISISTNPPDSVGTHSPTRDETEPCGSIHNEIKSETVPKINIKYDKQTSADCSPQLMPGCEKTSTDEQMNCTFCKFEQFLPGEKSNNSDVGNYVMCELEADIIQNGNLSTLSCPSEKSPQRKNQSSKNVSQIECGDNEYGYQAANCQEYVREGETYASKNIESRNSVDNSKQLEITGVPTNLENSHSVSNITEMSTISGGEVQTHAKEATNVPFHVSALNKGDCNQQPLCSTRISSSLQLGSLPQFSNYLDGITSDVPPVTVACDTKINCGQSSVHNDNKVASQAGVFSEFVTVPFTQKNTHDEHRLDPENIDNDRGKASDHVWSQFLASETSDVKVEDTDAEDKVSGWLQSTEQRYSANTATVYHTVPLDESSGTALCSNKVTGRVTDKSSSDLTESSVASVSSSNSSKDVRDHNSVRKHTRCSKVDRLANSIIDGKKIMILMRGLPGSGKSTLARHLVRSTMGEEPHRFIHSTDNFFTVCGKGRYKFNPKFLHEAHTWNVKRVLSDAVKGVTPIIVDNTNLEASEMRPYATIAVRHGYRIEFLEPNTYWRYFVAECARRNTHGVPIQRVADMMRRFDRSITVPGLLGMYQLQLDASDVIQPHVVTTRMPKHRRKKRKRNRLKRKIRKSLSEEKLMMGGDSILNLSKISDTLSCSTSYDSNCARFSDVGDVATNVSSKDAGNIESNPLHKNESIVCESNRKLISHGVYVVDGLGASKPVIVHSEGTEETVGNQKGERAAEVTQDSSNSGLVTRKVDDLLNEEILRECSASPDEYVLVKDSKFIFQKPHDIHKWLSERPPQIRNENIFTVGNTLSTSVNEESTDTKSLDTLENDNIQLNFNFDRQVNRLMEAMDREETAELRSLNSGNCVRTEFEKNDNVIGDECKKSSEDTVFSVPQGSDVTSEFVPMEEARENISENVSKLETGDLNEDSSKKSGDGNYKMWKGGEKLSSAVHHTRSTTVNDQTTGNAENNYVLWDLEHGNVWGGEDSKPNVDARVKEDISLPKPPRTNRKKLSVKDFLKESVHNLSQNATRPVQEVDQWDTVEDPLSSWESRKKNNSMSTDVRRGVDHSKESPKGSNGKFAPQPQRSSGSFYRSRKSASCVSQGQTPSENAETTHKIQDTRPPRSLSAAGNYAVNNSSNWSKYCSSIEPTAWKSEQNLTPETLSYPHKVSPCAFNLTGEKALLKDSVYTDCVTNTHYSDFLLLQQVNSSKEVPSDVKIIVGSCSAPIADKGSSVMPPAMSPRVRQSGKSVFDKSSMTEHEENFTKFSETEFKELVRAFPAVPIPHLQEIFQKCNRDINWTVDVLLELDYKGVEEPSGAEIALDPCTIECSDKFENGHLNVPSSVVTEKTDKQPSYEDKEHTSEECWQDSELKTWQYENEIDKTNGTPTQLSPSRTIRKDKNISPTAKELKEHIEQNIVLNEDCYSEHTLRIRKMRHGELLDMGEVTTSSNKNNDTILQIEDCDETSTCHGVIGSSAKQNILEPTDSGASLCPETAAPDTVVEQNTENNDIPTIDSNEAAGISDNEAFVDIKLGEEFVSHLHELFGKSSYTTVCETSATVKLPLCLALQIHYYLMKHEEEQIKQKQDHMIKEDEELARKIQENYGSHSKDEKVPDLREIMDMEMALALYKADQSFCHRETKETLAIKLSKRILFEMFPTFRKEAILDVFSSTDNSFDNTLAVLIASTSEEEAKVAMSPEALSEHRSQLIEAAEETVKRGVETISPLEDFDDITADGRGSSVLYIVERYREQAAHHYKRRSEYHTKAQEAFQKGMPSVAHYYSQLARLHKTHAQEASCRAATAISAAAPDSANLDLHGLYIREAICLLDSFLDAHIMRLKASGQSRRVLHVVTGRGNNSRGGQPRLRPAILQRLTQRSIKYEEVNEGLFRLILTRYNDKLTE